MQQVKKGFFLFIKVVCDVLMLVCVDWWWLIVVGFILLVSLMKLRGVAGKGLMGITGVGGSLSRLLFSWLLRNSLPATKVCWFEIFFVSF